MFDLETAIATWRHTHSRRRAFLAEDLDELERHLRDHTAALIRSGVSTEAAFRRAVEGLGDLDSGAAEYEKVFWGKLHRRHAVVSELRWRSTMLKNYLTIAIRTLRKHRGYALINITGLAVGFACSFFILLWVRSEYAYDRFLEDGDRIHQLRRNVRMEDRIYTWSGAAKPLADVLARDYPEIEHVALTRWPESVVVTSDGRSYREMRIHVGAAFFDVFTFPFIEGAPDKAFQAEDDVVITDRLARKLFGEDWRAQDGAVGRRITLDHRRDFTVTGVIADVPDNTSMQADLFVHITDFYVGRDWVHEWGNNGFQLYATLHADAVLPAVNAKIAGIVNDNEEGADETLFFQPFEDTYLYGSFENGALVGGRIDYVHILTVVAIFLLLIASINFMNLATARGGQRAREIGVRKAIGANQRSLIQQFLTESVLLTTVAFVLALGLVYALLPLFNTVSGKAFSRGDLGVGFVAGMFGIACLVGLLAGSYPALYLSAFNPLVVLRGTFRHRVGTTWLRKGLVVLQFALSVVLIVATIAIYRQIQFIRTHDIGLARENVLYLPQEGALRTQYDAFKAALLDRPGIAGVSAASSQPLSIGSSTGGATWEGKDPDLQREFYFLGVDYDFLETMQMEIVAGRSFDPAFGADSVSVLVNEEAARLIRDDVLGTTFRFWAVTGPIVGVVKDFEMNSLYDPAEPVVFFFNPEATNVVYVRTEAGRTQEAIASLEAVVTAFNPEYPFEYRFMDEDFEATYHSETVLGTLANLFSVIAIFISCLGLFGLISFTAQLRRKEMGVRKVLGATVPNLVGMLTGEMTRLVVIGIAVAIPVAYLVVDRWLAQFQSHIDIGPGLFVLAGASALLIAWLTVSYQSLKAALADPVDSLRYE
ncbi:MAG: ABC transporter permease [Rhodothermales bacterium]